MFLIVRISNYLFMTGCLFLPQHCFRIGSVSVNKDLITLCCPIVLIDMSKCAAIMMLAATDSSAIRLRAEV